jgi:hypothetical protein
MNLSVIIVMAQHTNKHVLHDNAIVYVLRSFWFIGT